MEERSRAVAFVFGGLSVGSVTGYVSFSFFFSLPSGSSDSFKSKAVLQSPVKWDAREIGGRGRI